MASSTHVAVRSVDRAAHPGKSTGSSYTTALCEDWPSIWLWARCPPRCSVPLPAVVLSSRNQQTEMPVRKTAGLAPSLGGDPPQQTQRGAFILWCLTECCWETAYAINSSVIQCTLQPSSVIPVA